VRWGVTRERDLDLGKLRERLTLVNQAIQTLENLARTEKQDAKGLAQESPAQARAVLHGASPRKYRAQHGKRIGQQRQR
jgi:hypothetical protein